MTVKLCNHHHFAALLLIKIHYIQCNHYSFRINQVKVDSYFGMAHVWGQDGKKD